jgi:quercetin dioxygenase-like cupin family protein
MQDESSSKPGGITAARPAGAAGLVAYQDGAVVSREIVRKPSGNVTIFAFAEGQGLTEHTSPFDALVHLLEGTAEITIAGEAHRVEAGEVILLPANQPHALKAVKKYKMILTMIK